MKRHIKRLLQIIFGLILIVAGIVMLVTPGQGLLTIALGILLISPDHGHKVFVWLEKGWWWLVEYFPKKWQKKIHLTFPKNWADRMRQKFHKKFHKK